MDELLIDEKKYVSSKQAAKITGYAKDYVGQLCREGRVPARLVGRSWYVLESAIQDHRFGEESAVQKIVSNDSEKKSVSSLTLNTPHYEATPVELLPKMREVEKEKEEAVEGQADVQAPENLQNSWRAWFDRVGDTISSVAAPAGTESPSEPESVIESEQELAAPEQLEEAGKSAAEAAYWQEGEIQIPIRTMYKAPPRELMPSFSAADEDVKSNRLVDKRITKKNKKSILLQLTKSLLVVLIVVTIALATLSSEIFDNLVISVPQVAQLSGILVYNK